MNCNFKLAYLKRALVISITTGAVTLSGCSNNQETLYESGFSLPNTYTTNTDFTGIVTRTPVVFENEDSHLKLAGIIFRPQNVDKKKNCQQSWLQDLCMHLKSRLNLCMLKRLQL